MENKVIVIFSISIAIIAIILLAVFFINQKTAFSPGKNQSILENCKTLVNNGPDKTNIVFFSPKDQARKYQDFFYTIPPFDKNKEAFNFFYIDDFTPNCEIYKGIALLCYNQDVIKKASSCPNDYIVVLKDQPTSIRSSSFMNVMSINSNHPLTVLHHEFGHAFAIFSEEYVPADIPRNSQNCQSSCDKFDIKNDCMQGCSKDNYYRSIDNGIMRTLSSSTYGIFDEQLIQRKIDKNNQLVTTGNLIQNSPDCSQQSYYLIKANYSNNQINVLDKTIQQGCVGTNGAGDFSYKLILNDNSVSTTQDFNPELIFTDAPQEGQEQQIQGQTFTNEQSFLLKVPIVDNSKSIEIYKDNNKLEEINLQNFNFRPCQII